MHIFECGTKIVTKIGSVQAIITAACIRFEKVQYEISYFVDGERKEVWVDEREFTVDSGTFKKQIGFKKESL